jgi:aspartyl-tRNA(Asn)/glutamyl-tRNA(Gln) amidotransferase subunit B
MYTPTIGLEVHAELKTKSKMFCGCTNDPHGSEPNTHICPVCLAHPGTLPVANQAAIKCVLLFGVAVEGTIADYSEFDRKNYFYPDIPKAYQLSQYAFPFVQGGSLAGVALTRVHLEEDTARSQHDKGEGSLVDFNRAGVPLMELVTEPVIHDAKTAGDFARELQLLLRTLDISDANMEKGEMRVEANISVSATGELGTKVEVKNLNSFRSVEGAIAFEIQRQIALLENGGVVHQETRGWDEVKLETFTQRSKETAKDYRYFPDPDLPKLQLREIDDFNKSRLADILPLLPAEKRLKYEHLGLSHLQIETILQNQFLDTYFAEIYNLCQDNPTVLPLAANYLITDFSPLIAASVDTSTVLSPAHFVTLISALAEKKITSRVTKDVIIALALFDADPIQYATEKGLISTLTEADLQAIVESVIATNDAVVAEYKSGKTATLQFLLGQAMKQTKGAADPATLKQLFEKLLG